MRTRTASGLIAIAAAVLLAGPDPAAAAQGFPWWRDAHFTRELGLTQQQSASIEAIFRQQQPTLQKHQQALDAATAAFEKLIYSATEEELLAQARLVESIRARLNVARTLMLVRMRAVLDKDQRVKLSALHQERERQAR